MAEKTLPEVIRGIKDGLMAAFAPHLSKIPPSPDGWTMAQHLEALAKHFVPMIEKMFVDPHAENRAAIEELRADIAFLKDRLGPIGSVGSALTPRQDRGKILSFFNRRKS